MKRFRNPTHYFKNLFSSPTALAAKVRFCHCFNNLPFTLYRGCLGENVPNHFTVRLNFYVRTDRGDRTDVQR